MEDKSSNKALSFLESNGLVQAYEYLLTSLCEHGLPTGDLYEFSALMVLKFEKKWKVKQRQSKSKNPPENSPSRKVKDGETYEQEQFKNEDKIKNKTHKEDPKPKIEDTKKKEDEKKTKPEEKKLKTKEEEKKNDLKKEEEKKNTKKEEEKKVKEEEKKVKEEEKKVTKKEEEKKPSVKDPKPKK